MSETTKRLTVGTLMPAQGIHPREAQDALGAWVLQQVLDSPKRFQLVLNITHAFTGIGANAVRVEHQCDTCILRHGRLHLATCFCHNLLAVPFSMQDRLRSLSAAGGIRPDVYVG